MTVFGRRFSPAVLVLSSALGVLCAASFVSLVLAAAGSGSAFGAPGRFLISAFSWAAFFAPLYLLCGLFLLTARAFRRRSALLLMFSIIPFLTLSLLLRVIQSPSVSVPLAMVDAFGVLPSALLLFLLLALEMIFILTMPYGRIRETPRGAPPRPRKPLALPMIDPEAAPFPVLELSVLEPWWNSPRLCTKNAPRLPRLRPPSCGPPRRRPVSRRPLRPGNESGLLNRRSSPAPRASRQSCLSPREGRQGRIRHSRASRAEEQGRRRLLDHRRGDQAGLAHPHRRAEGVQHRGRGDGHPQGPRHHAVRGPARAGRARLQDRQPLRQHRPAPGRAQRAHRGAHPRAGTPWASRCPTGCAPSSPSRR